MVKMQSLDGEWTLCRLKQGDTAGESAGKCL